MNKKTENKAVSPWQWVPSLYFAQGIPYVVVMSVAVILFKRMGMSNTDIALYTSGLNLPWVIKPLWSPLVDLLKTKRWWIVVMQILDRCRIGRNRLDDPRPPGFPVLPGFHVVAGIQFGHPRYCCRRILYVRVK